VRIRDATTADTAALAPLLGDLEHPADARAVGERLVALGDDTVLVADDGVDVVGLAVVHLMALLERPRPVAILTALVVAPSARGAGLGAALVAEAERRATAAGCWRLLVLSGRGREDAHAFYRHLGFEERTRAFVRAREVPV
jgi:GNAT superfamily N-acetyltransferase